MVRPLQALAVAVALMTMATSTHAQYSKMVMFGDSMSDTHRLYEFQRAFGYPGFPREPNLIGHFSNGKVAPEIMAETLGLPLQNYAFAGATSGYTSLILVPEGVLTQVNEHLADNGKLPSLATVPLIGDITSLLPGSGKADPKALYVIWTGPDDYYSLGGMNSMTAYAVTANIQQALSTLYKAGARYFFVPTMPDLGITPSAVYGHEPVQPGYVASATKYSLQCEKLLVKGLQTMRERLPQAKIMSFDTITFTTNALKKLKAEGVNVTQNCYNGGTTDNPSKLKVCADPDKYVFWDGNHLTARANRILGEAWAGAITTKP
jgi:cholinesterase